MSAPAAAGQGQKIKIDDKEYNVADLPEKVRSELQMVVYIDNKLKQLQQDGFALQTAKNAYLASVKQGLNQAETAAAAPAAAEPVDNGFDADPDTLDFSAFETK